MSTFTSQTKDELMEMQAQSSQDDLAVLASLIKISGKFIIKNNKPSIQVQTENIKIAEFILKVSKQVFNIDGHFDYLQSNKLSKKNYYSVTFDQSPFDMLKSLGIMDVEGNLLAEPSPHFITSREFLSAYLRGAFLASGSVNDPLSNGGYHLEISSSDEEYVTYLQMLLNKFRLNAKTCLRRNKWIVYLKRGESIADFLKLIQATQTLITFEDFRINKDFVNNTNRAVNCYCANEARRKENAERQLHTIELLEKYHLLDELDQKTKRLVKLRMENIEGSLSELSEQYYDIYKEEISRTSIRTCFLNLEKMVKRHEQ